MYYWNDIIGNEQLKKVLRKSAKTKKLSHSYLIDGAFGTGKKLIANTFAKAIFCETGEKDCLCHSCVQFDSNNHSDLIYVRPHKTKSIGVTELRERVLNDLGKKPFEYPYKIVIIEDADTMTVQAQNALLRSLEEPAAYVVFILVSSNIHKFLPTVLSRCFILRVNPLPVDKVYSRLENGGDRGRIAAYYSGGSIGCAMSLYERDDFFEMRDTVNAALLSITNCRDLEQVFSHVGKFLAFKDNVDELVMLLLTWLRDVLIYKATNNTDQLVSKDIIEQITKCADNASFKSIYIKTEAVNELKRSVSLNTTFNAALDALAIKFSKI